jgi:hypothetical protein
MSKKEDNNISNSQFLLYQDDNGITRVNVRFEGEDIWLFQQQLALLFDTTRENVVQHIHNIIAEGELDENRTCKKFLQVQTESNRSVKRQIEHYNLDMIIAVGYRVKSQVATRFRQWATSVLKEFANCLEPRFLQDFYDLQDYEQQQQRAV